MQSLILTATTAVGFLSKFAIAVAGPATTSPPDQILWKDELAFIGCFSKDDVGNLFKEADTGQTAPTRGVCRQKCADLKIKFTAISADSCWCGSELPSADSSDYLNCDTPCTNYPLDPCGSKNYFYIYGTDMSLRDPRKWDWDENPLHTGPLSTSGTQTQTVAKQSATVLVTASPTSSSGSGHQPKGKGASKAGAAAGAVVGVVLAIALGVAAFLYIRKQKRKRVEEEYRRNVAVREYAKKPEADMRLDPMMLHRRASDGSIADNQDYSRRILKVTNPDG